MKKLYNLVCIITICMAIFGGIMTVKAMESYAKSALVSLNENQFHGISMGNCSYSKHQGGAKATVQPTSSTYLSWNLYKQYDAEDDMYRRKKTENITDLSITSWKSTGSYSYGSGVYIHKFIAKKGSYTGNVEGLNHP